MFIYSTRNIGSFTVQLCETNMFKVVDDIALEQLTNQNVCFQAIARAPVMVIQI